MIKILLMCVLFSACIKKRDALSVAELDSNTTPQSTQPQELPLLRCFGLNPSLRTKEMHLPPPEGARKNAVSFTFTQVSLSATSSEIFDFLKPLFAMSSESRVKFSKTHAAVELTHLLPPAFQVAINNEFRFQTTGARVFAPDALMALVASSGREIELKQTETDKLNDFLANRNHFRPFGELLGSSKSPRSSAQERNAGFGVGDILVVREGSKLRHIAIWLDQDLYLDAQSFGQSVFFRVATFEQLAQELALRSDAELRSLSFLALRRFLPWAEIAKNFRKQMSSATRLGLIRMSENENGLSFVKSAVGVEVKLHQPD